MLDVGRSMFSQPYRRLKNLHGSVSDINHHDPSTRRQRLAHSFHLLADYLIIAAPLPSPHGRFALVADPLLAVNDADTPWSLIGPTYCELSRLPWGNVR